jgi:hypothetical protein
VATVGGMALVILGSRRVTRVFDFVIPHPGPRRSLPTDRAGTAPVRLDASACLDSPPIYRSRTVKSTVATVCSHASPSFPPVRVTSEKKNVSWSSFEAAFESTCIGTRTTSYFGS